MTHDIQVVRYMADDVAVMYLGKIMETGPKQTIFDDPRHPYTKALFSAVPVPDPESKSARIILQGETPTPIDPPGGCRFNQRCWAAEPGRCDVDEPALVAPEGAPRAAGSHLVACHFRIRTCDPPPVGRHEFCYCQTGAPQPGSGNGSRRIIRRSRSSK